MYNNTSFSKCKLKFTQTENFYFNLEEHLSKEQYLKLIDFAIQQGTFYFTFNVPNTECLDCHNIEKIPVTVCPKCGSKNVTQWTRIIG